MTCVIYIDLGMGTRFRYAEFVFQFKIIYLMLMVEHDLPFRFSGCRNHCVAACQ